MIQRNALKSWKLANPNAEVILFGDEEGAAEAAQEAGARHVANVERADAGPKILRSFFDAAQEMARHEVVCFVNCDMVLTQDFAKAVAKVSAEQKIFLMIGRRWDTDVREPIDFADATWSERLQEQARREARPQSGD